MSANLQTLRERLLSQKEILVVLSPHFNGDSLLAASALFSTLRQIADEGPVFNTVDFLITASLAEVQKNLVGSSVLKYIKETLDPRNYIVSIPKDGKVDKVRWREENDAFKLFLTPAYGDLSIEDLKFEQIGSNYKYIVLVGFEKLSDLGVVYSKNKAFFDRVPIAILGAKIDCVEEKTLSVSQKGSVTELVHDFLNILNVKFSSEIAQLILNGYVESVGGMLGNVSSRKLLNRIGDLLDMGATMARVGIKSSAKGTFSQLQLQQRVYANIKQDSSGILWSTISNSELRDLQIEDPEVNVNRSISFNSYQGYSKVFVLYELSDGTVWGKVETEDLDLPKVLKDFDITVCHDGLVIRSDESIDLVESKILKLLGSEEGSAISEPVVTRLPDEVETSLDSLVSVESSMVREDKGHSEENLPIEVLEEEDTGPSLELKKTKKSSGQITGLIKPADVSDEELYSSDPIVNTEDGFGPPKIFNSGSFGGPFSGIGNNKK